MSPEQPIEKTFRLFKGYVRQNRPVPQWLHLILDPKGYVDRDSGARGNVLLMADSVTFSAR